MCRSRFNSTAHWAKLLKIKSEYITSLKTFNWMPLILKECPCISWISLQSLKLLSFLGQNFKSDMYLSFLTHDQLPLGNDLDLDLFTTSAAQWVK